MRISDWSSDVFSSDLGRPCDRGDPVPDADVRHPKGPGHGPLPRPGVQRVRDAGRGRGNYRDGLFPDILNGLPVGAGLLAKEVRQLALVLAVPTSSGAAPIPNGVLGVHRFVLYLGKEPCWEGGCNS